MIMTYDFILTAKHNKEFHSQIDKAILSDLNSEICTDIHRLTFFPKLQAVVVTPKSDTSAFSNKIVPKKITYKGLRKMLNGNWNTIAPGDITDIDSLQPGVLGCNKLVEERLKIRHRRALYG